MSKLDQLRAMREARYEGSVTKPVTKRAGGRPRVHDSGAARQRAYRKRHESGKINLDLAAREIAGTT